MSGLKVTRLPELYPFELSTKELIIHKENISEYKVELSENLYQQALLYKPDLNLILQQPELSSNLRQPCLEFLLKIALKTKVTDGIFFQAIKIFDRYCSKRIVLRGQLQLVLGTCLWVSAKTYGGCNHVINNSNIPPGGRFNGPNPRARIPRLSELIQCCNSDKNEVIDQSMFIQMERHILNTLNWDIIEPKLSNWLFEFYELNQLQLSNFNSNEFFNQKLEIINIKKLLFELSIFELNLIELHPEQLTQIIFNVLKTYTNHLDLNYEPSSELNFQKRLSQFELNQYSNLLTFKLLNLLKSSQFLYNHYVINLNCLQFYQFLLSEYQQNSSIPSSPSYTYSSQPDSQITSKPFMYNTPNSTKSSLNKMSFSLPTPPNSRRGSPIGLHDLQKQQLISTPLTPTD